MAKTLSSQSRGPQVRSLVRELRSHVPHGAAKKKKKKNRLVIQRGGVGWRKHERKVEDDLKEVIAEES